MTQLFLGKKVAESQEPLISAFLNSRSWKSDIKLHSALVLLFCLTVSLLQYYARGRPDKLEILLLLFQEGSPVLWKVSSSGLNSLEQMSALKSAIFFFH